MPDLLSPSVPLASWGRPFGQAHRIPVKSRLRSYPHWDAMEETLESLARSWPLAAGAVERVGLSARMRRPSYAETRTRRLVTVSSEIIFARWAFEDDLSPAALLGFHDMGYSVGSDFTHVLIHEWGHVLVSVAVWRAYPHSCEKGLDRFVSHVENRSGFSRELAGLALSLNSQINLQELTAEAFVDFNSLAPHPFSMALGSALHEWWSF